MACSSINESTKSNTASIIIANRHSAVGDFKSTSQPHEPFLFSFANSILAQSLQNTSGFSSAFVVCNATLT